MENTQSRVRLEHCASKDHTAQIVDMITSEALEVCATSSLDNTIRIWDHDNCLLKIIIINVCARMITFSSVLGDIVFNAARHLYKICHENYLPPKYRAKIAAKHLTKETDEDSIVEDEQYRIYEDTVDRNLMLHPVISTPLASLDITSLDKPRPDVLIQKQICALYEYRDEDIRKIRDNRIEPRKRAENRALMTTDVWEKYVIDLLNSMTRSAPEVPEYDFKSIREKLLREKKAYNERGVFHLRYGYSADEITDEEDENLEDMIKDTKLPLRGFLPNSILYKRKEKEVPKSYVSKEPSIKKEPVKYIYPREFYPRGEEKEEERRESIRLSQIMAENMGI